MIRAIGVWCSVRSGNGQHWICRELFMITIDRQKPNQDLYYLFNDANSCTALENLRAKLMPQSMPMSMSRSNKFLDSK
eukprot:1101776-Pyramimonas_sp.AAC.1